MKLIVGLGNPGKEYEMTRHNAGYIFLDHLVCRQQLAPAGICLDFQKNDKFEAEVAETNYRGEKIILAKPLSFMNRSGLVVGRIMHFYKLEPKDLIVISDDIDLPLGLSRIRSDGSSGGHRGLENIIESLGTADWTRVKIGIKAIAGDADLPIETANKFDTADFVLSPFTKREISIVNEVIDTTIEYLMQYLGEDSGVPSHTLEVKVGTL